VVGVEVLESWKAGFTTPIGTGPEVALGPPEVIAEMGLVS